MKVKCLGIRRLELSGGLQLSVPPFLPEWFGCLLVSAVPLCGRFENVPRVIYKPLSKILWYPVTIWSHLLFDPLSTYSEVCLTNASYRKNLLGYPW